jgi:hypothetical protein
MTTADGADYIFCVAVRMLWNIEPHPTANQTATQHFRDGMDSNIGDSPNSCKRSCCWGIPHRPHLAKTAIRPLAHSQGLKLRSEQTEMKLDRSFRYGELDEDDRRSS